MRLDIHLYIVAVILCVQFIPCQRKYRLISERILHIIQQTCAEWHNGITENCGCDEQNDK